MTVATRFYDYQAAGMSSPHYNKGASPNLIALRDYTLKRWGGMDLGIFGVRPIRGGTALSTHASGAAWDWRYIGPGPGRDVLLGEVFPLFINHSEELGIQAIHDYVGGQIWRCDRNAWKPQPKSSINGMGYAWASWIHTEIHPDTWSDSRPVDDKLNVDGWPPFVPEEGLFGLYPIAVKPMIQLGATGDLVRYLQGVLRVRLGYAIGIDGRWGPVTNNFVIWFQTSQGLVADGKCGRNTWAAIDALA